MIYSVKSLFSKNEPTTTNHSVRQVCCMIEPAGRNNLTDSGRRTKNDVNTFLGKLNFIFSKCNI